jgi:hypothetical protein
VRLCKMVAFAARGVRVRRVRYVGDIASYLTPLRTGRESSYTLRSRDFRDRRGSGKIQVCGSVKKSVTFRAVLLRSGYVDSAYEFSLKWRSIYGLAHRTTVFQRGKRPFQNFFSRAGARILRGRAAGPEGGFLFATKRSGARALGNTIRHVASKAPKGYERKLQSA